MNSVFFKLLKTVNGYYVYDACKDEILEISREAYDWLNDKNSSMQEIPLEINELRKHGYLDDCPVEELYHPETEYIESYLDRGISSIILQVTQKCNLTCSYCPYANKTEGQYQRNHTQKVMTLETAYKCVDFFLEHSSDIDGNNIGFYGGEPMIEYPLVKQVIEYAKKQFLGKKITFSFTTNGTLLNHEMLEYFYQNNVSIMFSIDGPAVVHNRNRKFYGGEGSFEKVINNFEEARKIYNEKSALLTVNMVFDPNYSFKEIAEFADEDLLKDIAIDGEIADDTMLQNKYRYAETFIHEYRYELFKGYLEELGMIDEGSASPVIKQALEKNRTKLVNYLQEGKTIPSVTAPGGACVPGKRKLFVDVNGNFFPCERVNEQSKEMVIGNLKEGFDLKQAKRLLNFHETTKNNCIGCWAFRHCTVCVAAMTDSNGVFSEKAKKVACAKSKRGVYDQLQDIVLYREKLW